MGAPGIRYVLIDLPSDHEIDGNLVSEAQMLAALLDNLGKGTRVRHLRASTPENLVQVLKKRNYKHARYVHLCGHGSPDGLSLIGGGLEWTEVASLLKATFPLLAKSETKSRFLCLSTCHSSDGVQTMVHSLRGHFTGCFHFSDEEVFFADTMTTWSMFYLRPGSRKHSVLRGAINTFFGDESARLLFKATPASPRRRLKGRNRRPKRPR